MGVSFRRFFRCGGGAFTPSPTPAPSPTPTPAGSPDISTVAQLDSFLLNAKGGETATLAPVNFGQYAAGVAIGTPFSRNMGTPVWLKAWDANNLPMFRGTGTEPALKLDSWSGIGLDGIDISHDAIGANQGTRLISVDRSSATPGSFFHFRNLRMSAPVRAPVYNGSVGTGLIHIFMQDVTGDILIELSKLTGGSTGIVIQNTTAPVSNVIIQDDYFLNIGSDGIDLNKGCATGRLRRLHFKDFRPYTWNTVNPDANDHPDAIQLSAPVTESDYCRYTDIIIEDILIDFDKYAPDNTNMPEGAYIDTGWSGSAGQHHDGLTIRRLVGWGMSPAGILFAAGSRIGWDNVDINTNRLVDIDTTYSPSIDTTDRAYTGSYASNQAPRIVNMGGLTDAGGNVIDTTKYDSSTTDALRASFRAGVGVNIPT